MLSAKWDELNQKLLAMSVRERAIILATSLVLVIFLWLQFVYTPIEDQQASLRQASFAEAEQVQQYARRIEELTGLLAHNPNDALQREQQVLQQKLMDLGAGIEAQLAHLLAPQEMADVLQQVLADYQGLRLLKARNLAAKPLELTRSPDQTSNSAKQDRQQAAVFVHGFEMTLAGDYFQTLAFIQYLEEMSGFFWHSLDYQLESYPNAQIILQLNTLSLEEDWIGV